METAAEGPQPGQWIEVQVEGFEDPLRLRVPKEGAVMLMMAGISAKNVTARAISRYMNGIMDLFDEDSRDAVEERIMDPDDEFDLEQLSDMWGEAMEQWTARPTQPSSGSTGSRTNTGKKSTGRASVRASASQRSRPTGSSTPSTPG